MPTNNKVYLSFGLCAIGLIGLTLYNQTKQVEYHSLQPESGLTTLHNVHVVELDETGKLNKQLDAPTLTHHSSSSRKTLKTPVIYLTKNKQPWIIQADVAHSNHDNSKIVLTGHVKISQFDNNHKVSELQTTKLNYYPKTQKVDTKQDIIYLNQGLTIHSKGLKADLHEETMELVSNARGTYVPNKKS